MSVLRCPLAAALTQSKEDAEEPAAEPERLQLSLLPVQHQYENAYWERHENWDFATAALHGSSYYELPKLLQWLSGNIGFHHIHHLSPRIPNYKLEACHKQNEIFQVEPLTLRSSLKSLHIRLYDEDRHKMVGYHPHEHHAFDDEDETPANAAAAPSNA